MPPNNSPNPTGPAAPYLNWALQNYNKIPGADERLAGKLASTEASYGQAEQGVRAGAYASGGQGGGVQRLTRAQVPMEKAGAQAGNLYEHETWKAETAKDRLAGMLFPYLSLYNQAFGSARGYTQPGTGSGWEDYLQAANEILDNLNKSGWLTSKKSSKSRTTTHWSGYPQSEP